MIQDVIIFWRNYLYFLHGNFIKVKVYKPWNNQVEFHLF